jgi:hypothetical protein
MGLDTHKRLTEMHEDGDVENNIGIQIEVLDAIVPEHALEKVTSGQCQSTLRESGEHGDLVRILLHWIQVAVAVRHRSISFSRRNPLLTKVSRSSVFNLAFFHSLAWLGRRVDDNDDSGAEPSASLQVLFFPALVFMLSDRDAFILEVTGVFTHIRSGATLEVDYGSVYRSNLLCGGGGSSSSGAEGLRSRSIR